MITIIDYGLGNLNSIYSMFRRLGIPALITGDIGLIEKAEKLILPGVGAFDNGMRKINERGLAPVLNRKVLEERVPVLGICLGMQLMADTSEEGREPGLGWIAGRAARFAFSDGDAGLKIPHMGWNTVDVIKESSLSKNFLPEMRFYFVHSYHVVCKHHEDVLMTTNYGGEITAAVRKDNVMGTQFHPEKSHKFGMLLLRNFSEMQ